MEEMMAVATAALLAAFAAANKHAKELKLRGPNDPEPVKIAQTMNGYNMPDLNGSLNRSNQNMESMSREIERNQATHDALKGQMNTPLPTKLDTLKPALNSQIKTTINPEIIRPQLPPAKDLGAYNANYDALLKALSDEYVAYRSRETQPHRIPFQYDYGANWRTLPIPTRERLEPYFDDAYRKVVR